MSFRRDFSVFQGFYKFWRVLEGVGGVLGGLGEC